MDRSAPLLSVVVPAHRVGDYLPECLDSVLAGTGDEVEVVAVDDGCDRGSGVALDAYAERDPRVRVLHLPVNTGLGPARNTGLGQAAGAYVWFVDGDDRLAPGAAAEVIRRLAATGPDVLVVGHAELHPGGREVPQPLPQGSGAPGSSGRPQGSGGPESSGRPPGPLAEHPHLLWAAQSACTKVARRDLLEDTGLRFTSGWYEDGPFSHAVLLSAGRIDVLDRVCYHYRQRADGGITRSVSRRHFDVFAQYDRLWTMVDGVPAYERFRPELFRLMIDHYLVVAGHPRRVPAPLRRGFFTRMAADYRRRLPPGGYPMPDGVVGALKHRLVARDSYLAYAALRLGWRAVSALWRGTRRSGTAWRTLRRRPDPGARRTGPAPAAPAPAAAAAWQ